MTARWCAVLCFASAGASSAYLTVSEVFPVGTRALVLAGIVEIFPGVRAERRGPEDIAQPLTAADVEPRPRQARAAT